MRLKRESPTPLYLQLKNALLAEIDAGRYRPHQRLLSERELCERFKVSRMTVRQALTELTHEGVLYTQAGKGTFVSEAKINQELSALTGFSQDMRQRGSTPSSQVLEAKLIQSTMFLSTVLKVPSETEIVILSRLRLSDNIPMALETAYLPHKYCPGILQFDFAQESLYAVLESRYNTRLVNAEQSIEAGLATPQETELLELIAPAAVLRIERLTYSDQNILTEYVVSAYRGDRYKFRTKLQPIS